MSARPKKRLEWSRRSAQDLLAIEEYIAQDNQSAADAVIAHIQQRAILLKVDPLLGKQRMASPHRELVLSRYPFSIIYSVRGDRILISRILHQRRQFP